MKHVCMFENRGPERTLRAFGVSELSFLIIS